MQDEGPLYPETFKVFQRCMSLKLLKIICRVFWTHHLSTPEVLAVCVPSKRGLLDLSARNI